MAVLRIIFDFRVILTSEGFLLNNLTRFLGCGYFKQELEATGLQSGFFADFYFEKSWSKQIWAPQRCHDGSSRALLDCFGLAWPSYYLTCRLLIAAEME